MSAAAWAMATAHDHIAHAIARDAYRWNVAYEDAVQAARLGLFRAAVEHDPALGGTYEWRARRRALDEVMAASQARRSGPRGARRWRPAFTSLDAPVLDDVRFGDLLAAEGVTERMEIAACRGAVLRAMALLPARERNIIERRLQGESLRRIGRRMGITESRVHQLHTQAIRRLRLALGVRP